MLKGSCLCGGIRYEIDAELRIDKQLSLWPVPKGVRCVFRHRCDDSGGFVSIRRGSRTTERVGIFSREAAMFLRTLWFTDSQTQ